MSEERRRYIQITLFYNCLMLAMGLASLAVSVWLAITGRLAGEGVDAVFLFAAGLVLGGVFWTVPALSIRDGFLRDLRELWEEGARRDLVVRTRPQRAWQHSHAH